MSFNKISEKERTLRRARFIAAIADLSASGALPRIQINFLQLIIGPYRSVTYKPDVYLIREGMNKQGGTHVRRHIPIPQTTRRIRRFPE